MRHATVLELADEQGIWLPEALTAEWPPQLSAADEKGWFRFQRLYDIARSVVTTEAAVRRLVLEAAEDEAAEGSRWLEIQVDPSGYAAHFGGITAVHRSGPRRRARRPATRPASRSRCVIAANRTRHPLDARTLARLAAQYAGRGVVGFGLSNDERRGEALAFAKAFDIAARAGLLAAPHGGELCGAESVWSCLDGLGAHRIGHGVRSVEDPTLVAHIADAGVTLEVCPQSNVALGVYPDLAAVPLARAVRCRRADRARRRRPAAVRLAAARPVRGGPRRARLHRRRAGRAGPDVDPRLGCAPTTYAPRLLADIDTWLASPPTA